MKQELFRSAFDKLKLVGTLFLASSAAVSFYFVGIFSYVGLELMTLVDKQSLFEAILFYSALFSVTLAVTTLLTAPFLGARPPRDEDNAQPPPLAVESTIDDRRSWLSAINKLNDRVREMETSLRTFKVDAIRQTDRWRIELQQYVRQLLPAAMIAAVLLVFWLLHVWKGLVFLCIAAALVLTGVVARRFIYQLSLLAFFLLGFMRADFLMEAPTAVAIYGSGEAGQPSQGSIILSSSRGVLAVVDAGGHAGRHARFLPWDKIGRVEIDPKAPRLLSPAFLHALLARPACLPLKAACFF